MSRLYRALTALERTPRGLATTSMLPVGVAPRARYRWPAATLMLVALSGAVALTVLPRGRSTALPSPPTVRSAPDPDRLLAPELRQRARDAAVFGLLEEAEALLQHAVTLGPADAASWNDLGVVLVRHAQRRRGIEAFRRSVALDPKHAAAHRNLAVALEEDGKATEAVTHYRAFLALAPDDPDRGRVTERLTAPR